KRRGDQIVQINIKTPVNLTKKQETLLKEFAKLEANKFSNKLKNILHGASAGAKP
ncbi:MAG: molecular chaperone DnaJ, partial [Desulfobacterales bacterium]|nr:molecular chaperone DnaJ [Desulfobacterales bacterium]